MKLFELNRSIKQLDIVCSTLLDDVTELSPKQFPKLDDVLIDRSLVTQHNLDGYKRQQLIIDNTTIHNPQATGSSMLGWLQSADAELLNGLKRTTQLKADTRSDVDRIFDVFSEKMRSHLHMINDFDSTGDMAEQDTINMEVFKKFASGKSIILMSRGSQLTLSAFEGTSPEEIFDTSFNLAKECTPISQRLRQEVAQLMQKPNK